MKIFKKIFIYIYVCVLNLQYYKNMLNLIKALALRSVRILANLVVLAGCHLVNWHSSLYQKKKKKVQCSALTLAEEMTLSEKREVF